MPLGRPRAFDADKALDKALKVFWRKGYEGASLPDLTAAMGINRPSLYAAFGNKESLFKKAIERYSTGPAGFFTQALAEPTARAVVEKLLQGGIDMVSNPKNPKGCLMVQGALACGDNADCMRQELAKHRQTTVTQIRKRFEKAKAEGDLPQTSDPADLARYIATLMHGLAVQSATGATRAQLQRVANLALKSWPT